MDGRGNEGGDDTFHLIVLQLLFRGRLCVTGLEPPGKKKQMENELRLLERFSQLFSAST